MHAGHFDPAALVHAYVGPFGMAYFGDETGGQELLLRVLSSRTAAPKPVMPPQTYRPRTPSS
ncbi:MAG: hypothetical protein ACYDA1_05220, partial [Vulcanimicrobiaceae bacterium]